MSILNEIVTHKLAELEIKKASRPVEELEKSPYFSRTPKSLVSALKDTDKSGIIAEFKRKSPSRGMINGTADVVETTKQYVLAGASGLSILTDNKYFGGSDADLSLARDHNDCPILRKDFIVDEYQVIEAKAIGADVILLIATTLNPAALKLLANLAHSLGMEVLMEVHDEHELLKNVGADVDLIGVNNRNLNTFKVNVEVSKRLASLIPDRVVKVSESGIEQPETISALRKIGYHGFLIGQRFMEQTEPGMEATKFIQSLA